MKCFNRQIFTNETTFALRANISEDRKSIKTDISHRQPDAYCVRDPTARCLGLGAINDLII